MAQEKLLSPVTGVVWKRVAAAGDVLESGAAVLLLESMKMEIPVCMPRSGKLLRIAVNEEDGVNEGQVLAEFE